MSYSRPEGKSVEELEAELRDVFDAYPEYNDTDYGPGTFEAMVEKFANDDFYKNHFVAKAYLQMKEGFDSYCGCDYHGVVNLDEIERNEDN